MGRLSNRSVRRRPGPRACRPRARTRWRDNHCGTGHGRCCIQPGRRVSGTVRARRGRLHRSPAIRSTRCGVRIRVLGPGTWSGDRKHHRYADMAKTGTARRAVHQDRTGATRIRNPIRKHAEPWASWPVRCLDGYSGGSCRHVPVWNTPAQGREPGARYRNRQRHIGMRRLCGDCGGSRDACQEGGTCTAPGSLDTHLCYAAWRSSYSSRASIGV